jgi:hypothetical protein
MENLQILLKKMGESKVILTYTKLPKPIFATYYRDKHISAIGINRSAMITKNFELEVFKAAVGLHKTLSNMNYKIIIDDNNIDMLASIGEAIMQTYGIIKEKIKCKKFTIYKQKRIISQKKKIKQFIAEHDLCIIQKPIYYNPNTLPKIIYHKLSTPPELKTIYNKC